LEFKPWQHHNDEWEPCADEMEFIGLMVRISWAMMYRTKKDLMKAAKITSDEEGEKLLDGFSDAAASLVSVAKCRLALKNVDLYAYPSPFFS
jgi:hypothetical protein